MEVSFRRIILDLRLLKAFSNNYSLEAFSKKRKNDKSIDLEIKSILG